MNKQGFKDRMKLLKQYKEQNPDKGYWEWRNSLPDNLKYTDDNIYDMKGAYESGAQPVWVEEDKSYHLPTRDPQTGRILKKSLHPTFLIGMNAEAQEGYYPYQKDGKWYTDTWKANEEPIWEQTREYKDGGTVTDWSLGQYSTEQNPIYYDELADLEKKNKELKAKYDKYRKYETDLIQAKVKAAEKFNVPYLKDKEITLSKAGSMTGTTLTTNLLDSIQKYADKVKLPIQEAIGLAAQESTLGQRVLPRIGGQKEYIPYDIVSDWAYLGQNGINQYLTKRLNSSSTQHTKDLSKEAFDYTMSFNRPQTVEELKKGRILNLRATVSELQDKLNFIETHKTDYQKAYNEYEKGIGMPPFEHAFKYYKEGKYNPGDPRHTGMVKEKGRLVMQSPEYKKWESTKRYEEGGEIPPTKPIIPEDPQPYKGTLYKDRYGKKYTLDQVNDYYDNSTDEIDRFTGKPLIRGLKPLVDLEDAANVTPLGDAISAYDAYTAAKNSDWGGVGAALLSMIPFVPMTVKEYRHLYQGVTPKPSRPNKFKREVPKVNKDITTSQINAEIERRENERYYRAKAKNEGYALAQRLTDDPEYLRRARQVKEQFGDDQSQ